MNRLTVYPSSAEGLVDVMSIDGETPRPADRRFAALAAVLARAVASGELEPAHARGVLAHQLRKMNVNSALKAPLRSSAAQEVIDRYGALGLPIPKNGSNDALHCDHVHALRAADLIQIQGAEAWLEELPRLKEVVCVTAAENYQLEKLEKAGADGWSKYEQAGISLLRLA